MKKKRVIPNMFCRTMFCKKCAQAGRPRRDIWYFVFGGASNTFHLSYHSGAYDKKYRGLTPHLIEKQSSWIVAGTLVVMYSKTCLIEGCGAITTIDRKTKAKKMKIIHRKKNNIMDMDSFEALYDFTDTGIKMSTDKQPERRNRF